MFIFVPIVIRRYTKIALSLALLFALALAMTGSGHLQGTLSAATNLAVSSSGGTITATWTPGVGATSQTIVVVNTADDTDFCLHPDTTGALTTYQCAGRSEGETYKVLVIALDGQGGHATTSTTHTVPSTTATDSSEPDLEVGTLTVSDTHPTIGAALDLDTTVTNRGRREANATDVRFYRSTRAVVSSADVQEGSEAVAALANGASSSHSIALTAPSEPGTYYYRACVDRVSGEFELANNCSNVVTVTVIAPDLLVNTPIVDGSVGTNFTMAATVVNQGSQASAATTLTYYRSTDATITADDMSLGTYSVAVVAAGGSNKQSHSVTTPTSSGSYYYGACVASVTGESDTNNNCSAALVLTIGSPDLAVSKPTVSTGNPAPGGSFTLSATVRNQGSTATGASVTLTYYRSTDATISSSDTSVGTADSVSALAGYATSDQSTSVTAPTSPGDYYYGACVGTVSGESNTANNCSDAVKVTVSSPNLLVDAPTLVGDAPSVGGSFTLSARVLNQGGAQSASTTLNFYLSSDGSISASDTAVGNVSVSAIAASGVSTLSAQLTAPSTSGAYYYGACVVAVTGESDTDDNCSSAVSVTVGAPDLTVSTPSVDGANPAVGAAFTLEATVSNRGRAEAAASTVRFYRSYDTTIETTDTALGSQAVDGLNGGSARTYSIGLTAPSSANDYYYGACVDTVSDESDTNNNCSGALTVTVAATAAEGVPDLWPWVSLPKFGFYGPDQSITVGGLARNTGAATSAATTMRYYRSTDTTIDSTDTQLGTGALASLEAGGSVRFEYATPAPSTAGDHYYGVCIDTVAGETKTGNNCSTGRRVTVALPDMRVTASNTGGNVVVGESFTLRATVTNSSAGLSAPTTMTFLRSTDSAISTNDTALGTDNVGSIKGFHNRSFHSIVLTAPSSAGTYYYGACVAAATGETNLDNNCSSAVTVVVDSTAAPDLVVSTPSKTGGRVVVDESFTLKATVTNRGSAESAATSLTFYRSTDNTINSSDASAGTGSVGAIAEGSTSSHSISVTAPSTAGTYYYGACVASVTDEPVTTNNCSGALKVVVDAEAVPDLVITGMFALSQSSAFGSTSVTLSAGVRNQGSGSSDATTLRFYQSDDATISGGDDQVGTASVGGLSAGSTGSYSHTITLPTTAGTYHYGVCVDAVADESSATNNCSSGSVSFTVE